MRSAAQPERRAGTDGAALEIWIQIAKSIVKIRFLKEQPKTAWNLTAANEYGFYSNFNPDVDHPRWSQATERRIGEDGFFTKKRKTLIGCAANLAVQGGVKSADGKAVLAFEFSVESAAVQWSDG